MDKLPSSAKQMDCRMMWRSLCSRMIAGESGCSRAHGLAYFKDGRFVARKWRTQHRGVFHHGGHRQTISGFPGTGVSRTCGMDVWSKISPGQRWDVTNKLRLWSPIDQGGLWLAFWIDGGVLYFKDGQVRASYTAADGLGKGHVAGLRLDRDGAVWAANRGRRP